MLLTVVYFAAAREGLETSTTTSPGGKFSD